MQVTKKFNSKYQDQTLYYKRFNDDIFIIWLPGQYSWKELQQDLSFGRMTWRVEQPKKEANFLDLTIMINNNNHIVHKTYDKTLSLHNYSTADIHLVHLKV